MGPHGAAQGRTRLSGLAAAEQLLSQLRHEKSENSESVSHSVVSDSFQPRGLGPARLLCPWNSPGKNAGMGRHCLLLGIFPTQRSNPGLPRGRQMLYYLSQQGNREPGKQAPWMEGQTAEGVD